MILHALHDYYHRRCADPDPARRLAAFGLELKEIAFILELDAEGQLKNIADTRRQVGKKTFGTSYLVPKGVKRSSGIAANLLWDNAEYVLGLPDAKKLEAADAKGKGDEYRSRVAEMHEAFAARIAALPATAQDDEGLRSVLRFLQSSPCRQAEGFEAYATIAETNPLLSFRLVTDNGPLVSQRASLAAQLASSMSADEPEPADETTTGLCLVTGETSPIATLHTSIKGVWGAQTAGANIVSFNLDAFNSHGRSQGRNAPVGQAAEFAYTTALNAMLARDSAQRIQVGDASTVFWAQRPEPLEDELAEILQGDNDDPDAHVDRVKTLLAAVHSGTFNGSRGANLFYVLGLAPNAARIAVRFWHAAPLSQVASRVASWFDDLRIVRGPNDPEFPSLFRLLAAVAVQGKADNIPPRLGGDLARAIFGGVPYPSAWLMAAVQRCRAERQVGYLRAAAIKACLNRPANDKPDPAAPQPREMTPMLDLNNMSAGYRLGRLFAVLEKIQEEASPGLNTTIRERYYGAASSTPVAVFTSLMRLKNHHLVKLPNKGRAVNFERLIAEIVDGVKDFPAHMGLPEQGRFAIGYYQQRQDLYPKRDNTDNTTQEGNAE